MNPDRTILHVDMDAFFAAVEQHDRPELRGLPVVIGSSPDRRGVVSTCSYEARRFGLHSAMPSRTAFERCPHAVFLPVRMARYKEVSRQIMLIFESFTPLTEPVSIDEAFLDVTGSLHLFGDATETALKLKQCILETTGLTCSVGVAPNKFLAKLASDMNKPDGLTVVPADPVRLRAFLAPLPIGRMWGVGRVTRERLEKNGIRTFGDLQEASLSNLTRLTGSAAETFKRLALGEDDRAITGPEPEKSISREITFPEDLRDRDRLRAELLDLTDEVGRQLRRAGFYAGTVRIKVRWSDFQTITRQRALDPPCRDDAGLRDEALRLFGEVDPRRAIRLIGFGVSTLTEKSAGHIGQTELFEAPSVAGREKQERISQTVDALREWLGRNCIRRGSSLRN